jgi:small subunit ribosomal protein S17
MAKTLTGIVTSDKADKTIVVSVQTSKRHPLYRKQYMVHTKFMAHDESNSAKNGDTVVIEESRPLSARKRFVLKTITDRAHVEHIEDTSEVEELVLTKKKKEAKEEQA